MARTYSYRNASIGLSSDACFAGQSPKTIPTSREKTVARITENIETFTDHPATKLIIIEIPLPSAIPANPPINVISTATIKNSVRIKINASVKEGKDKPQ
jgi:hypothetical protein